MTNIFQHFIQQSLRRGSSSKLTWKWQRLFIQSLRRGAASKKTRNWQPFIQQSLPRGASSKLTRKWQPFTQQFLRRRASSDHTRKWTPFIQQSRRRWILSKWGLCRYVMGPLNTSSRASKTKRAGRVLAGTFLSHMSGRSLPFHSPVRFLFAFFSEPWKIGRPLQLSLTPTPPLHSWISLYLISSGLYWACITHCTTICGNPTIDDPEGRRRVDLALGFSPEQGKG